MKIRNIIYGSLFLTSQLAFSSPFPFTTGKMKIDIGLSSGKSEKIILGNSTEKVGISIDHTALISTLTYGLSPKMDIGLKLDVHSIKGGGDYSGLSGATLKTKYMFFANNHIYSALSGELQVPSSYDTNQIAAPGKGEIAIKLQLSSAYYNPSALPLYFGLDIGRDQYFGDVPAQNRWLTNVYYMHGVYSAGVFYGATTTENGKKLKTTDGDLADNETRSYAQVQEEFTTYGASIGMQVNAQTSASFALSMKPESGLKYSDVNTTYVLNVGYTL